MNYLAHAHLSFNQQQVLVGNMISDFIKGKKQFEYSPGIQKGIQLHRSIDAFTDGHPVTKEMNKIFKPAYGLYSGAFTDIVYDYFLANDKNEFPSDADLENFSRHTYTILEENLNGLPPAFQQIFPYMKKYNWLYNYRQERGIQKSFGGLVSRAKYMDDPEKAFQIFRDSLRELEIHYKEFFPALKIHATQKIAELLNNN